jgi:hypothetical protein
MNYQEIQNLNSFEKKEQELKTYYLNLGVLDWLYETGPQHIKFKDRIEYKENRVLHSLEGPALEYDNGDEKYYLEGEEMTKKEWQRIATAKNAQRKIQKIKEG